jgi:hypothetical protein
MILPTRSPDSWSAEILEVAFNVSFRTGHIVAGTPFLIDGGRRCNKGGVSIGIGYAERPPTGSSGNLIILNHFADIVSVAGH